jgi:hypothetical protein
MRQNIGDLKIRKYDPKTHDNLFKQIKFVLFRVKPI